MADGGKPVQGWVVVVVVVALAALIASGGAVVWHVVLKDYQRARVRVLIHG